MSAGWYLYLRPVGEHEAPKARKSSVKSGVGMGRGCPLPRERGSGEGPCPYPEFF